MLSSSKDGRKAGRRKHRSSQPQPWLPSEIVCSANDLTNSKNSMEFAVILSLIVVIIYAYGSYEAMLALPEIPNEFRTGANLNMAMLESDATLQSRQLAMEEAKGTVNPERKQQNLRTDSEKQQQRHPADSPLQNAAPAAPTTLILDPPEGKWPVTLRDEVDDFEDLLHVGDLKTVLKVPKFWSPPLHNKQFYSREQAMKVGTCIETDPKTGSHVRGESCPPEQRTIYIGLASYRDYQCRYTLESAFLRAKHPERIRVGVVDQIIEGEDSRCDEPIEPCDQNPNQALCKYKNQVDVFVMDAPLSVGPVFARHIGYRMYRGEYYATQSDAHVTFTTNWDEDIIAQLEATHDEMAVLSTYLSDIQGSIDEKTGKSLRNTRPIMCNTDYEGGPQGMHLRHMSQPERHPTIRGTPQLQPWWAAGYSFSRGHFVVNVPYDYLMPMIFQGEEMSIGIRGFTVGYDFYAPERSVCFHHYATGKNAAKRNKVKKFWENGDRYKGMGKKAMARLLGIVHMNPEVDPTFWDHTDADRYGLGGVRTPEQFYDLFGIDVVKKTTQGHLCKFVGDDAQMHKDWFPLLRKDGMGIDYSTVKFRWVDPYPNASTTPQNV
ncbi:glycosyltransferase GlcNAc [Nitzschia inconspicua]|uniref:Glycosyltransferase GlcNAc n=1 Tax=Nitzschia inconspicua TaxID=303405 RepID=A0A9K3LDF6_9STRA|nr:glycosyltransferase GlcNAc [Nitzschia inconspicua]